MSQTPEQAVGTICKEHDNDRGRMLDIVRAVQERFGCVCGPAMEQIAAATGAHRVEVESMVSFYAFLSTKPKGKIVIRLCNDIIDEMADVGHVAPVFEEELGIRMGQTTPDGQITLEWTPCIGMSDQAPAALVNDVPVTYLSSDRAREICRALRRHGEPKKLVKQLGSGNNTHELIQSMVVNNLRKRGPVVFAALQRGEAIRKAVAMSPAEVIREVKTARLRGRGGAGFPTGMKWEFTRGAPGQKRYILCNADEGEPGTFKDRVILTEKPHLMFEGMTIAGYAVGSDTGIVYLRAEYAYLRAWLEHALQERREAGLLGKNVAGKDGFDFDIRIQMGAGAYVCGEETSLISSCEGLRGDPKKRPPFPAQEGYFAQPTVVNNVETFCCAARILEKGPGWFAEIGTHDSPGTKLLSVSGDVKSPGVYELPFGVTVRELLEMTGAEDTAAVQVGGAAGVMIGPDGFDRAICYEDLATGGSVMVFDRSRDLLAVVQAFVDFFREESCGYCTPCRVGTVLMQQTLRRVRAGKGTRDDLDYMEALGETMTATSRCGLGQTAANPVLSSLKSFRKLYESLLTTPKDGRQPAFDVRAALADSEQAVGRASVLYRP